MPGAGLTRGDRVVAETLLRPGSGRWRCYHEPPKSSRLSGKPLLQVLLLLGTILARPKRENGTITGDFAAVPQTGQAKIFPNLLKWIANPPSMSHLNCLCDDELMALLVNAERDQYQKAHAVLDHCH